jgi:OOP family OmpA-OmpF porin
MALFSLRPTLTALVCATIASFASAGDLYVLGGSGNLHYPGSAQDESDSYLTSEHLTGINSSMGAGDTGLKVTLGYTLNPNFAIEGRYVDIGSSARNASLTGGSMGGDYGGNGLNVSGLGIFALNNEVSVFGKAGLSLSNMKGSAISAGISALSGDDKTILGYGMGGIYNLTSKVGLRLEWEKLFSDVSLFSLGLQAKF